MPKCTKCNDEGKLSPAPYYGWLLCDCKQGQRSGIPPLRVHTSREPAEQKKEAP